MWRTRGTCICITDFFKDFLKSKLYLLIISSIPNICAPLLNNQNKTKTVCIHFFLFFFKLSFFASMDLNIVEQQKQIHHGHNDLLDTWQGASSGVAIPLQLSSWTPYSWSWSAQTTCQSSLKMKSLFWFFWPPLSTHLKYTAKIINSS